MCLFQTALLLNDQILIARQALHTGLHNVLGKERSFLFGQHAH